MEAEKRASTASSCGDATSEGSTRCDACKSCGAILELDGCGHRFHPRCVYSWPLTQCEQCAAPVSTVRVFREYRDAPNSMARKGKWAVDEHKYANMMMKQFQAGALPLVDGLHLRGFIASLLQCDPLRVTKKYAGHAIGKQNFLYQQHKGYCYNLHVKLQKRVSSLRNHFYWHIQYRCKFGYSLNIQELKAAEVDYWIREFLRFAAKIGQKVEMPASPAKLPASPLSAPSTPLAQAADDGAAPERRSLSPSPDKMNPTSSFLRVGDAEPKARSAYSLRDIKMFSQPDATAPSSKELSSSEYAVSPLSFDEWTDAGMADMTSMAFDLSQPDMPMALPVDPPSQEASATTVDKKPVTSKTRLSLGHWIEEADLQWREAAVSVPSWSFSQLSDSM